MTTGSASVVIAVIDSGVYSAHPDLAPKLVAGWNFVKSSADTSDVIGHGTEVAGTVAAATNNAIGVAGVSWGSLVMPLVVVDDTDFAAYSDIAAAIQYAVDRNVRVINVSIWRLGIFGGAAERYRLRVEPGRAGIRFGDEQRTSEGILSGRLHARSRSQRDG